MLKTQHRMLANYRYAQMRVSDLARQTRDDEGGEMGSWMILAAGLAVAAVAAVAALGPWFQTKVTSITSN
jgi:hypothetical protein